MVIYEISWEYVEEILGKVQNHALRENHYRSRPVRSVLGSVLRSGGEKVLVLEDAIA